jgi:hypothetical protein
MKTHISTLEIKHLKQKADKLGREKSILHQLLQHESGSKGEHDSVVVSVTSLEWYLSHKFILRRRGVNAYMSTNTNIRKASQPHHTRHWMLTERTNQSGDGRVDLTQRRSRRQKRLMIGKHVYEEMYGPEEENGNLRHTK